MPAPGSFDPFMSNMSGSVLLVNHFFIHWLAPDELEHRWSDLHGQGQGQRPDVGWFGYLGKDGPWTPLVPLAVA